MKDPREALILSLKRAVVALQEENLHLRHVVDLEKSIQQPTGPSPPETNPGQLSEQLSAQLSDESQVENMVHNLLHENRALRKENADLYALREALLRQQEAVTKHNERLIRQIEGKPQSVHFISLLSPHPIFIKATIAESHFIHY